ncbi:MAG TPA: YqjK-like family protein [Gallionella sp.]|nr:YqjK-like family protein [Gallionella sp.]
MKARLAELAFRRSQLLEKIDAQRMELSDISRHFEKPLALVDAGLKVVRYLRGHPVFLAGGLAILMLWRGKGLITLAQGGQQLWRLYYPKPSLATEPSPARHFRMHAASRDRHATGDD